SRPISTTFSFSAPSPTEIYTLSLHDALPIWAAVARALPNLFVARVRTATGSPIVVQGRPVLDEVQVGMEWGGNPTDLLDEEGNRSEEHTSELQSRRDLVCRLLLEKKKNKKNK